jgi:hypothetical protein
MSGQKYMPLSGLDRIEAGDEFTWNSDDPIVGERQWFPCETFVGQRVEKLTKRSNVIFRRPVREEEAP